MTEDQSNGGLLEKDYLKALRQEAIDECLAHQKERLNEKDADELLGEDFLEDERQGVIGRLIKAKIEEDEQ